MTPQLLGFFDSGLGGLTVLRRVLERHGPVHCVYLGDTARVPYGNRQPDDIRHVARLSLATLLPLTICLISGSAPKRPIKSTLFKLPAIIF